MKSILFSLFIIATTFSFGQISFKTGDSGLDAELNLANTEAKKDLPTFKSNLSAEFGISVPKIDGLLKTMLPGEIVIAVKISNVANKPIDSVIDSYKRNKDKGWGVIAKEMGIKPGSPEFHALKGKKKKASPSKGKGNSGGKGNGKGKS